MSTKLTEGAIEAIVSGNPCDSPFFQILSFKQITSGSGSDRYRLLVSDGKHSYSHVMLATQLNPMMETNEMDNLCVVKVNQYICNTLQGERRVMILLEVEVVTKGADVGGKIGNPQAFKPGQQQPAAPSNNTPAEQNDVKPAIGNLANGHKSPPSNKAAFNIKPGTPGTPGSSRIHGIASLTPYQNRVNSVSLMNRNVKDVQKTWQTFQSNTKQKEVQHLKSVKGTGDGPHPHGLSDLKRTALNVIPVAMMCGIDGGFESDMKDTSESPLKLPSETVDSKKKMKRSSVLVRTSKSIEDYNEEFLNFERKKLKLKEEKLDLLRQQTKYLKMIATCMGEKTLEDFMEVLQ